MKKAALFMVLGVVLWGGALESTPAAAGWHDAPYHRAAGPSSYRWVHYDDRRYDNHHGFEGPHGGPRPFMRPSWAEPHIHVWDRWDRGYWTYSRYHGRMGWWWVVDGYWFMYPARVLPYPDYDVRPVYIVEPNAPAVIVEPQPVVRETVIINQPPAALPAEQSSPTYTDHMGRTCREYQSSIIVGGVSKPAYGTACLQPDGTWRVVK